MLIPKTRNLIIFSEEGKILEDHTLPLDKDENISFYSPSWYEEPYKFLLVNNSYANYREYLVYDIEDSNFINLDISIDSLTIDRTVVHYSTAYMNELNSVVTSLYNLDNNSLPEHYKPFVKIGMNNQVTSFGEIPRHFSSNNESTLLYPTFLYDNHRHLLLSAYNNDDKVNFWDPVEMKKVKSFSLNSEKKLIDLYIGDYDHKKGVSEVMRVFSSFSHCDKLYKISEDLYALTNFKYFYKNNNRNDYELQHKIIVFNFEGKITKVLELSKNLIPFHITDDFVLCSELINSAIGVKKVYFEPQLNK